MPFVANTPESLLDRADSKNPNSTCRGITSSGRPCRRPVNTASQATLSPRHRYRQVVDLSDESVYCWQHKEQASHSAQSSPGPRRSPQPILEERTSLDTLADRLGILALSEEKRPRPHGHGASLTKPPRRVNRADTPKLQFCFCFTVPLEETSPPSRPRPRPQPGPVQKPTSASVPVMQSRLRFDSPATSRYQKIPTPSSSPGKASNRSTKSHSSETAQFKHLVPDTLDAVTASALLAELAKPHAESEEPGYIYMFWLTPADKQAPPPVHAARSLLVPPANTSPGRGQRSSSDIVSAFADPHGRSDNKTMLLKIGRAANVQRRMNQWQRQCGYDIEMLRYYPYIAGTDGSPGASRTPRMTPHCRRVERLIHIELAGMGMRANLQSCNACGREHREWFEVTSTRDDIRRVDDVIRRWVDWDEMAA